MTGRKRRATRRDDDTQPTEAGRAIGRIVARSTPPRRAAIAAAAALASVFASVLATPASAKDDHDQLFLRNDCDERIQALLRYKPLSGDWETRAWFAIDPGDSVHVANTRNRVYYVYAEEIGEGGRRWSGEDSVDRLTEPPRIVGLAQARIESESWGRWTHRFACDD